MRANPWFGPSSPQDGMIDSRALVPRNEAL